MTADMLFPPEMSTFRIYPGCHCSRTLTLGLVLWERGAAEAAAGLTPSVPMAKSHLRPHWGLSGPRDHLGGHKTPSACHSIALQASILAASQGVLGRALDWHPKSLQGVLGRALDRHPESPQGVPRQDAGPAPREPPRCAWTWHWTGTLKPPGCARAGRWTGTPRAQTLAPTSSPSAWVCVLSISAELEAKLGAASQLPLGVSCTTRTSHAAHGPREATWSHCRG